MVRREAADPATLLHKGRAADASETFRWVGGGDNLSLSTAKHNSVLNVRQ